MIGIYKFENKTNGKIYIGQSINIEKRLKEHINNSQNSNTKDYSTKFYRAIRKYGIKDFTFEIIEEVSKEKLNEREAYWVASYNSYKNGYNSNQGGERVTENQENHPMAKLSNIQALEIKETLKNTRTSQYEIASKYNITQSEISQINQGVRWSSLGVYNYPIRKDEKAKGANSPRAKLTNEQVLEIRKRYVSEIGKKIYEDYTEYCSYITFERALTGRTYTDVPIYKKKEKVWINKPVSTIP